ncbi:Major facilitator superfamily domain, general substrate transporter [Niveomyces insectorum RCEF 264]|uniref:Major facilitator superfamily domain, general substrate transporter n=1 Tax=Niveomyces insectorum RCEF 264 TaxID=1081102 RepID=A0A167MPA2_9HYPO|nr:Major facilitator superfamily domain, general substrate transporter [Niveomyces insectorum RCEF 264]
MKFFRDLAQAPVTLVRSLRMTRTQFLVFVTSWSCWTLGSVHFYCLAYTMPDMAKSLGVQASDVAYANTTSMVSRALGAIIFGVLSDQYGRKIPLLIILALMGVCTLCTGFVQTYGQLVGVRLLFGIMYGGLYGPTMAAVTEAMPRAARGIVAGFTQQGFSAGNLLASGFHLAMGLTIPVFLLRLITPSYSVTAEAVQEAEGREVVDERAAVGGDLPFLVKLKYALRHHWPIFIYCTVMASCFNTLGHGHLDVYPTFLQTQRNLDVLHETWVSVLLQSGGVIGGAVGGYMSRYHVKWVPTGFAAAMGGFLPLFILPTRWNLLGLGAFFMDFCYGAAIGNIGNILQMVCPHAGIRGAFGGITYNFGNAVSSIGPTIEAKLGKDYPLPNGTPNYGREILTLAGILIGLLTLTLACMPTKNVNMEWDLVDPNQIDPAQEPWGKTEEQSSTEPADNSRDIEALGGSKNQTSGVQEIEMATAKQATK